MAYVIGQGVIRGRTDDKWSTLVEAGNNSAPRGEKHIEAVSLWLDWHNVPSSSSAGRLALQQAAHTSILAAITMHHALAVRWGVSRWYHSRCIRPTRTKEQFLERAVQ
jgi:hypothetical protein